MYSKDVVLLAFFLGMVFGLFAEEVIRKAVWFLVSLVMGLPTKPAPDASPSADQSDELQGSRR